jgi:uncharacterized Zn finger protein
MEQKRALSTALRVAYQGYSAAAQGLAALQQAQQDQLAQLALAELVSAATHQMQTILSGITLAKRNQCLGRQAPLGGDTA